MILWCFLCFGVTHGVCSKLSVRSTGQPNPRQPIYHYRGLVAETKSFMKSRNKSAQHTGKTSLMALSLVDHLPHTLACNVHFSSFHVGKPLTFSQRAVFVFDTSWHYLLKLKRTGKIRLQDSILNCYAGTVSCWVQEACWLWRWSMSHVVYRHRSGRSHETQSVNLTSLTPGSPVLEVFILLPMLMWSAGHLASCSNRYLPCGETYNKRIFVWTCAKYAQTL